MKLTRGILQKCAIGLVLISLILSRSFYKLLEIPTTKYPGFSSFTSYTPLNIIFELVILSAIMIS